MFQNQELGMSLELFHMVGAKTNELYPNVAQGKILHEKDISATDFVIIYSYSSYIRTSMSHIFIL